MDRIQLNVALSFLTVRVLRIGMLGACPRPVNAAPGGMNSGRNPDKLGGMRNSDRAQRGAVAARMLLAVLALALAVVVWRAVRPGATRAPATAGGVSSGPGVLSAADSAGSDADVERALRLARENAPAIVDSTAIKNAWHDEVTGVDLGALPGARRSIFLRFANAERCTCGCGYTLAGCLASDMTCEISRSSVSALLDSVNAGRISNARGVRERPRHD
jgi:hypothetical protein